MSRTLQNAIDANRRKWARYSRATRTLQAVRARYFDYEDIGPAQVAKAERVAERCKTTLAPLAIARGYRV